MERERSSEPDLVSEVRLLLRRLDDLILLNRLIQPVELFYLREMIKQDLEKHDGQAKQQS